MKKLLAILAIALGIAAPATATFAGGLTEPKVEAPVALAQVGAVNWTGFYAGATAGKLDTTGFDKGAGGIILGYRQEVTDLLVLGAEAEYKHQSGMDTTLVKAQAGLKAGNFLPYATIGWGEAKIKNAKQNGLIYGVGLDYQINRNFVVGAEALKADDKDLKTFGVRVAYKF